MVSEEKAFAECLGRVRRRAKAQGSSISREQVQEEFAALELNAGQLEMVYDYLEKHGVGIGGPGETQDCLTGEERDYLQQYLEALAAMPDWGQEEKEACAASAMAGDREAGKRLTEGCLRDVADIARLYAGQGIPLEDLVGEGNVALAAGVGQLGAVRAEAAPSEILGRLFRDVMDAMEELIRENANQKKADRRIADKVNRVADSAGKLAEAYHRKVTPKELAQETGLALEEILDAVKMSGNKIEDIEYTEDGL